MVNKKDILKEFACLCTHKHVHYFRKFQKRFFVTCLCSYIIKSAKAAADLPPLLPWVQFYPALYLVFSLLKSILHESLFFTPLQKYFHCCNLFSCICYNLFLIFSMFFLSFFTLPSCFCQQEFRGWVQSSLVRSFGVCDSGSLHHCRGSIGLHGDVLHSPRGLFV